MSNSARKTAAAGLVLGPGFLGFGDWGVGLGFRLGVSRRMWGMVSEHEPPEHEPLQNHYLCRLPRQSEFHEKCPGTLLFIKAAKFIHRDGLPFKQTRIGAPCDFRGYSFLNLPLSTKVGLGVQCS